MFADGETEAVQDTQETEEQAEALQEEEEAETPAEASATDIAALEAKIDLLTKQNAQLMRQQPAQEEKKEEFVPKDVFTKEQIEELPEEHRQAYNMINLLSKEMQTLKHEQTTAKEQSEAQKDADASKAWLDEHADVRDNPVKMAEFEKVVAKLSNDPRFYLDVAYNHLYGRKRVVRTKQSIATEKPSNVAAKLTSGNIQYKSIEEAAEAAKKDILNDPKIFK